jgi:hypothetical protein
MFFTDHRCTGCVLLPSLNFFLLLLYRRPQLEFGGMDRRKGFTFIGFWPVAALRKRYGGQNRSDDFRGWEHLQSCKSSC